MGRTKRKTPEETDGIQPKRSRKKAEPAAAVPELEAFDAAREAKSRHVDEPQPESRQENEHPNGPLHERNGQPNPRESVPPFEPGSFAARVSKKTASFAPIPEGFMNVDQYRAAGIRVNKSLDYATASIQFADNQLPTRDEKDFLEAIHTGAPPFAYDPVRRQWERHDRENPGANIVDAKRIAADLANEREGRGR